METQRGSKKSFDFYFADIDTFALVKESEHGVIVRVTRNSLSLDRKMRFIRQFNGCAPEGKPWGEHCTLFPSTNGTPVVEFIHAGGHVYPEGANAAIVRFFKEHSKK